jgi:predicted Zn-dependent protease with MMP-like domain
MWPFRVMRSRRRLELGAEAMALLPEHVRDVLARVPIVLADRPSPSEVAAGIPETVSGCFIEDVAASAARDDEDGTATPGKCGEIRLYFENIDPLTAEGVAGVLLHETAHVLGFDDAQAKVLGL